MKKLLVILLSFVCLGAYSQSFYSVQPEGAGTITDSLVEYIFTDTLYDTNYVYTYDEDSTIIDSTLDITEYTIDDTVELVCLTAVANEGYEFIQWEMTSKYYIEAVEEPIHTQLDTLEQPIVYVPKDGILVDEIEGTPVRVEYTLVAYFSAVDGIKDINQITYRVFPNPANNMITVKGDYDNIIIYNQAGQQVINTNKSCINISNLQQGMYYLQIFNNGKQVKVLPIAKMNSVRI